MCVKMRRGTLPTGNFYTRRDFIDERKMSTLGDVSDQNADKWIIFYTS